MKRHRRHLLVFTLVLIVSVVLSACGAADPTVSTQAVTLAMGFIPNVQFTPFYVAVDKEYFSDEGIDINFDYGWETDILKLVGSDDLQFGIASGDQVILARSQGLPVVYVLNWYRRFPVCVVSLAEAGIRSPEDLVGKRVGTPATYGASYIGWRALLGASGLDETDTELISIGYTQVTALTEKQVDAAICYAMNEPVELQTQGQAVDVLYVADYANLISNGLITNEKSANQRPELVQGMVRAALRGLAYTIEHPDEAFEIALKYVPEAGGDSTSKEINRAILAESIEFWRAGTAQLGISDETNWLTSQKVMEGMGLVSGEADISEMYTNDFATKGQP